MKIILIGYGKMGKAIEEIATAAGHTISHKFSSTNIKEMTTAVLQQADVAIEFTQPDSVLENISKCIEAGIPIVTGTTGWYDKLETIKEQVEEKNTAFVYASNFSVGVNLFFAMNEKVAAIMNTASDYQISIDETHHTQKKDSPSGTALSLEKVLQPFYPNTKIPIIDHRLDPVVGTHTVFYKSAVDTISLTHEAHSRTGFATGAVKAAEWIVGKKGCYSFREVLGI